jgi:hypothetical protein
MSNGALVNTIAASPSTMQVMSPGTKIGFTVSQ